MLAIHLAQTERRIPFLSAKVDDQRNHGGQPIFFLHTRKIFFRCTIFSFLTMLACQITHLLFELHGIVQHVANRHGIMHMALILYSQHEIGVPIIRFNRQRFKRIAVFLRRFRLAFLILMIWNHILRCIHIGQLFRLNHLFAIINQIVKSICKHFHFRNILFGCRILNGHVFSLL